MMIRGEIASIIASHAPATIELPPCPACGGPVIHVPNFGGYGTCITEGCHVSGPDTDPDGSKWKAMCAKLAPAPHPRFEAAIQKAIERFWSPPFDYFDGEKLSGKARALAILTAELSVVEAPKVEKSDRDLVFSIMQEMCYGQGEHPPEAAVDSWARILTETREAAAATIEALNAKIKSLAPHGTCGCSYDTMDDVCDHHSPKLVAAEARIAELEGHLRHTLIGLESCEDCDAARAALARKERT
jgi:hypothetical protein